MKTKLFLLALLLCLISIPALSQSLSFCEDVDDDGYPISPSKTFTIGSSGGYLKALVRVGDEVNSSSVKYVIYRNDDYDNTIYQDTDYDWTYFWKEITFYKSGDYDVYVYDDDDNLITSGSVRIKFR